MGSISDKEIVKKAVIAIAKADKVTATAQARAEKAAKRAAERERRRNADSGQD